MSLSMSVTRTYIAGAAIRIGQIVYGVVEGEGDEETIRVYPASSEHKPLGIALNNAEPGDEVHIIVKDLQGIVMGKPPTDGPYIR